MPIEEWTRAAAADDALVADLLLRLKHSRRTWSATTSETKSKVEMVSDSLFGGLARFRWGRRKTRSRTGVTRFVVDKECRKRAARSPSTPLSWSDGSSVSASGNADGYDASGMMCYRTPASRSKIYTDLKEEEGSLLLERQILKRDLASLCVTQTDHRMINENLKTIKRMKVQSKRMTSSAVAQNPFVYAHVQGKTSRIQGMPSLALAPHDSKSEIPLWLPASMPFYDVPAAKDEESFMLPDLNMLPSINEEPF